MAFATVITLDMNLEGNRRLVCGQTTSDGTDGDIVTGLTRLDSIIICHKGAAVEAAAATIKSTMPLASGTANLICTSGDVVYFQAIGQ
tara:strand:- start:685 stop:948 length:264 start_codon:yes stop_codon:yes gene_type:complete